MGYKDFYYVNGSIFKHSESKLNGKAKAIHYCREKGIDESEIYELSSENEQRCLETLLELKNHGAIYGLKTHETIKLIDEFVNSNGEKIPAFEFKVSFTYQDSKTHYYVYVVETLYKLSREIVLAKTLFDYKNKHSNYPDGCLRVVYYDTEKKIHEWHIGDNQAFIQERKEQYKKIKNQKRAIRDNQKYDRLLKLRKEGKITEAQTKELYRLEKVFGGR